jgi:hypothetical protein
MINTGRLSYPLTGLDAGDGKGTMLHGTHKSLSGRCHHAITIIRAHAFKQGLAIDKARGRKSSMLQGADNTFAVIAHLPHTGIAVKTSCSKPTGFCHRGWPEGTIFGGTQQARAGFTRDLGAIFQRKSLPQG